MKSLTLISFFLLTLSFLAMGQDRAPAVENDIFVANEQGNFIKESLGESSNTTAQTPMVLFTLLALLGLPLTIYALIQKQAINKKTSELYSNVVLLSEYQKRKTSSNREDSEKEIEEDIKPPKAA